MLFVENLTVKAKDTVILKDISFFLETSSALSIIGPSGSGKTTLANAVVGFTQGLDCHGSVSFNNIVLQKDGRLFIPLPKRTMSYIPQNLSLWPHVTVQQTLNLAFAFAKKKHGEVGAIVELLDLWPLLNKRPHQLSGGEQQRLALARALAQRPKLLVLDEPFCALDPVRRNHLINLIKRLHEELQLTIMLITHDLLEAHRIGDKIMVLENGEIRFFGPKEELSSEHFSNAWNPYLLSDNFSGRFRAAPLR